MRKGFTQVLTHPSLPMYMVIGYTAGVMDLCLFLKVLLLIEHELALLEVNMNQIPC